MLEFIYTGNYDDAAFVHKEGYDGLLLNMMVLEIADQYDLPELASLAFKKFKKRAIDEWEEPAFTVAAEGIYAFPTTDKHGLRAIVVGICVENASYIFPKSEPEAFNSAEAILAKVEPDWWRHHAMDYAGDCNPSWRRAAANRIPYFGTDLAKGLMKDLRD